MGDIDWNHDRELLRLSDLTDSQIQAATVILATSSTNPIGLGSMGSRDIRMGLLRVAQFMADESQRRILRKAKKEQL